MNLSEIQELIKFVAKAGVNEVEIEKKDFKLLIKSDYLAKKKSNFKEEPTIVQTVPVASIPAAATPIQEIAVQTASPATETEGKSKEASEEDNYITIKAQMIGTFYRAPSPDKPAYVEIGATIKPGDKICIIEAMKLFNDIESEVAGKVIKVLVDDASPVEFDQPLFLIDPS
jgi:acetyl-CoA carboxylase biotin carboxyl carrier protein